MISAYLRNLLLGTALAAAFSISATARPFDISGGSLEAALDAYTAQTGTPLIVSNEAIKGIRSKGVKGDLSPGDALLHLLDGTGFTMQHDPSGAIGIVPKERSSAADIQPLQLAQAAPARQSVETVTVTSSKLGGADVQSIPIAITALSQEQLTSTQTAGGPDLVKQVPNLTFTKTNFTGYSIQIRGIGTQAVSVTTDPAVAIALNDTPFIRNHFFEQEFFDLGQVQIARGPQGTLYGRNATAGVVNLITAKPTDDWEAKASVDVGNYNNRRLEGMINAPLIGDKLDVRIAGEWTKRDGYTYDDVRNSRVDGRDLWSSRLSILLRPTSNITANLMWEHFSEDDDRQRSGKQLCKRDPGPSVVDGPNGPQVPDADRENGNFALPYLTQGCLPVSLYSPEAFQTPNAGANPFILAGYAFGATNAGADPYGGVNQSPDLRTISSALAPHYRARNDTVELNTDWAATPELTLTSLTAYSRDNLYSTEDANGFGSAPGVFIDFTDDRGGTLVGTDGIYCDPQLGCSDRFIGMDISQEHAEQFSQEFHLTSNFSGPLNFTVGANYLHYSTVEDFYIFYNALSIFAEYESVQAGPTGFPPDAAHIPFDGAVANACDPQPASVELIATQSFLGLGCAYIDPHPLSQIDGNGHNYFRSQNPYLLNSWAGFGEANYQVSPDVKLTAGLRWTDDQKKFTEIPSWAGLVGEGYFVNGIERQEWSEWTGRFNAEWTPKLDFTDQSMFYASYSRGYKGGGANPPSIISVRDRSGRLFTSPSVLTHPATFDPEFVNAFELGSKNTLLDGALTLNADVFYYAYQNYQISQIVDRTAVNLNFNAHVHGAELEGTWEPLPGLTFNFAGGWEDATLDKGSRAIDLMDRTAGHSDWIVVKPFITQTSNCIMPTYVINEMLADGEGGFASTCLRTYTDGTDPVTGNDTAPFSDEADYPGYAGFDPATAPNGGAGFDKDLTGNKLPNTPPLTLSAGAQYSMPISADWAATLRGDYYWQDYSWARIFNDNPYDRLRGYTNVNFSLIFTNQDGWQAMAYVKNVFDQTAITGAFLNSDDLALTTNVFLTDPRLFGIRITKNW
ncbi:MAG TPA: TonB-dependent receptor [Rhizomicrobium sp.]|nr:TonB-dependent receptor [Rhizomicrobium sp.]